MRFEGKWTMNPTEEIVKIISIDNMDRSFKFIYQEGEGEIIDNVEINTLSNGISYFEKSSMFDHREIKIAS